jgi:hypothetical protein
MSDILILDQRGLLHHAIRDRLALVSGKPVGLWTVPDGIVKDAITQRLVESYAILYPLDAYPAEGSLGEPDANMTAPYQLTSVGRDGDHAQWMNDACRGIFLQRDPNGDFTHPFTVANLAVTDRRLRSAGAPEPGGGGLWQAVDTYELEVSA